MLLWVRLVLSLLNSSASMAELRSNIDSLPKDLGALYVQNSYQYSFVDVYFTIDMRKS